MADFLVRCGSGTVPTQAQAGALIANITVNHPDGNLAEARHREPLRTGRFEMESWNPGTGAVMDMWKAFGNSTARNAPQAAILFDKFHVLRHLGAALDSRSRT